VSQGVNMTLFVYPFLLHNYMDLICVSTGALEESAGESAYQPERGRINRWECVSTRGLEESTGESAYQPERGRINRRGSVKRMRSYKK
ncbi:hypothetical protein ACFQ1Y_06495, partial [Virgibacillus alimentarius]